MRGKLFIIASIATALLTSCNNNANIEKRFHTFVENNDYTEDNISQTTDPDEARVTFDLKNDINVTQYRRDTLFGWGDLQLGTRFTGPANKDLADDYAALLKFSMQSPDETGFEFESIVDDIIVHGEPNSEVYFTNNIRISIQNLPDNRFEEGEAVDVRVHQNFPDDVYGGPPSELQEKGIEQRLKPQPLYVEMSEDDDKMFGVHKIINRLVHKGLDRMSGYMEYGDNEDIPYYDNLDQTLESYIPFTEKALDVVEHEAIKKDLEETYELLKDLEENTENIDSYAENESIVRLAEIYRDLEHYVGRNFRVVPTNTTHFANEVAAEKE
ncbi:hypothetical protein SAMN05192534_12816 [Alteribacillus persepolensis]|uniref:Uncharacterized protein n=1 Tax=Alteribacillus persepolensis TaxID=568899 RepID=A0A1G8J1Z3_9BACI|nr:hypothetical protein [Alteribacillus persepolensis]SDI25141.1 hypothetical protein SAMN05192534_12816 [Alteribacillus persepolensis]